MPSKSILLGFLLCVGFACTSNDEDEVNRARCEALRDHLVELRLQDAAEAQPNPYLEAFHVPAMPALVTLPRMPDVRTASDPAKATASARTIDVPAPPRSLGPPQIDLAAHRAALKRALGDQFLTSCQKNVTSAQLRCVLDAENATAAASCYRSERSPS